MYTVQWCEDGRTDILARFVSRRRSALAIARRRAVQDARQAGESARDVTQWPGDVPGEWLVGIPMRVPYAAVVRS